MLHTFDGFDELRVGMPVVLLERDIEHRTEIVREIKTRIDFVAFDYCVVRFLTGDEVAIVVDIENVKYELPEPPVLELDVDTRGKLDKIKELMRASKETITTTTVQGVGPL